MIEKAGHAETIRKENPDSKEIKLGGGLLTPGLVNLHHHLYSAFARGWSPPGSPPENFKQILEKIWWRLDETLQSEDIYYSALVGLGESLLSGVTSVVDHHSSQNQVRGSLESIALHPCNAQTSGFVHRVLIGCGLARTSPLTESESATICRQWLQMRLGQTADMSCYEPWGSIRFVPEHAYYGTYIEIVFSN